MDFPAIMPGSSAYREVEREGQHYIEYAYRSERGQMFSCTGKTLDDAQEQCEQWLLLRDRH